MIFFSIFPSFLKIEILAIPTQYSWSRIIGLIPLLYLSVEYISHILSIIWILWILNEGSPPTTISSNKHQAARATWLTDPGYPWAFSPSLSPKIWLHSSTTGSKVPLYTLSLQCTLQNWFRDAPNVFPIRALRSLCEYIIEAVEITFTVNDG